MRDQLKINRKRIQANLYHANITTRGSLSDYDDLRGPGDIGKKLAKQLSHDLQELGLPEWVAAYPLITATRQMQRTNHYNHIIEEQFPIAPSTD